MLLFKFGAPAAGYRATGWANRIAYCQSALLKMLLPFRLLYSSPKRANVGTTSAVTGTGKLKVADVAEAPG